MGLLRHFWQCCGAAAIVCSSAEQAAGEAIPAASQRVAICITGTWRSFGEPKVYESIATNVVEPLKNDGAEVGLFYFIDSQGVSVRNVLDALDRLPPRVLAIDTPQLEVPDCLRATWELISSFVQFAQLRQCYDAILQDERSSSRRWDWLMRLRTDMEIFKPLGPLSSLDPNYLYMPPRQWWQELRFPTGAWGYSYQCFVIDDKFVLAPRAYAYAYFDYFSDICVSSTLATFVCFTPHVQYMMFWRLRKEGVPVRFLTSWEEWYGEIVRPGGSMRTDAGLKDGALHAQSELRYQSLVASQPFAFGDGLLGTREVSADAGTLDTGLVWSGAGPQRVVLESGSCFRDHVKITGISVCISHGPRDNIQGFLHLRVYRPSDEVRQLWRLVGISDDIWPGHHAGTKTGCINISLGNPIIAAPGDYFGYMVEERLLGALHRSMDTNNTLLGWGGAYVGEFDYFDEVSSKPGFAIRALYEHLDHRKVSPQCFQDDTDRIITFEFCCDMEASGPEGNPWCFEFKDGVNPTTSFSYTTCCIAGENYLTNNAKKPTGRSKAIAVALGRMIKQSKQQIWEELKRLAHEEQKHGWPPYDRVLKMYSRPGWPEGAPDLHLLTMGPKLLAEVLRGPRRICEIMFMVQQTSSSPSAKIMPITKETTVSSSGQGPTLFNYCMPFVLLHARIISAFVSNSNSSMIRWLRNVGAV